MIRLGQCSRVNKTDHTHTPLKMGNEPSPEGESLMPDGTTALEGTWFWAFASRAAPFFSHGLSGELAAQDMFDRRTIRLRSWLSVSAQQLVEAACHGFRWVRSTHHTYRVNGNSDMPSQLSACSRMTTGQLPRPIRVEVPPPVGSL